MDAFEWNKIAGAVLFAVLVMFGMRTVSNLLFAAHPPEKPGYEVEIAESEAGGDKTEKKEEVPLPVLLASADADRGKKVFKKCSQCHSVEEGKKKPTGPSLYGVLGRDKAGGGDFAYSAAMKDKGGKWGYDELDGFIAAPKKWLPGTKMAFAGIKRPNQRADLILYLRSLSASPMALPEAQTAAAEEKAPAEEKAAAEEKPAEPAKAAQ